MRVNAHLSVQMSPHRPGEANPCYILDLVALQKNFMFMCSLFSERTTFTCWLVYQPWSVFASHLLLQKFLMPLIIIVSAPKCLPDLPLTLFCTLIFHFVGGPVLSMTDPTFYLSYLIFMLSDIWSLLLVLKKKRAYWKKIKQMWFLKCTVLFSDICLKYVSLPISKLQTWSRSGILRTNNARLY